VAASRPAPSRALAVVAEEAASCQRCDLYRNATQTVFGEGPVPAPLMLVGEQPGDQEDRAGHPFVGPAGRLLDDALEAAAIDRHDVYVTNAVKHFKWEPRGKRRIHKRPSASEVLACNHWLDREIELVAPRVVVALGATALRPLFTGRATVSALRGAPRESRYGMPAVVTVHPSAIVRIREPDERQTALDSFVSDLRMAASAAATAV
jgi:uracil-DNA glycosylase family protein